jgi:hypothetical protein
MPEQTFEQAVKESRVFFRRDLILRMVIEKIRKFGHVQTYDLVLDANEITKRLAQIEDAESA